MKSIVNDYKSIIPESFYDIFIFIIPPAILVTGIAIHPNYLPILSNYILLLIDNWILSLFVSLIAFGILYSTGIILTCISFYLIYFPIHFIIKKSFNNIHFLDNQYLKMQSSHSPLKVEMTKRYVRLIFTRNNTLTFFLVFCYYLIVNTNNIHMSIYIIVSLVLFATSFISTYLRAYWLFGSYSIIHFM